jgi:hypothetical protein
MTAPTTNSGTPHQPKIHSATPALSRSMLVNGDLSGRHVIRLTTVIGCPQPGHAFAVYAIIFLQTGQGLRSIVCESFRASSSFCRSGGGHHPRFGPTASKTTPTTTVEIPTAAPRTSPRPELDVSRIRIARDVPAAMNVQTAHFRFFPATGCVGCQRTVLSSAKFKSGTSTLLPHLLQSPDRPAAESSTRTLLPQCGHLKSIIRCHPTKKERRTKPAPDAPAKGPIEQHLADAPLRGRGTSTASIEQEPLGLRLAVCLEAVLDAHASIQIVSRPVRPLRTLFLQGRVHFWPEQSNLPRTSGSGKPCQTPETPRISPNLSMFSEFTKPPPEGRR